MSQPPAKQQDTVVEEALDSIRKIIRMNLESGLDFSDSNLSENHEEKSDSEPLKSKALTAEDVLILTESLLEDGSILSLKAKENNAQSFQDPGRTSEPAGPDSKDTQNAESSPLSVSDSPSSHYGDSKTSDPASPKPQADALISDKALAESAAAFAELAKAVRSVTSMTMQGQSPKAILSPETAGHYTLEALMRDLLRPMLKEWLNAHLPSLVKWLVTEQIEKMVQDYLEPKENKTAVDPKETIQNAAKAINTNVTPLSTNSKEVASNTGK